MNPSSLAPEFVCLTTSLDLELEGVEKDLTESVVGVLPVLQGPTLGEPSRAWIFVYFVVKDTSL